MRILKKEVDYSVRALTFIVRSGRSARPVTAKDLYSSIKAPRPFLRKILQELSKEKILFSSKGRGGGFRLSVPPDRVTLSRLARVFGGKRKPGSCHFGEETCPNRSFCALKSRMEEIEKRISSELEKTTLEDLMSNRHKG